MDFIYSQKEMSKVLTIEKVIDKRYTIEEAMAILGVKERQIYKLKAKYKKYWPPWLIHWLKWKPSNHQWDNTKYWSIKWILKKYPKYYDFWPTLLSEHLESDFGIIINKETLRQIMISEWMWIAKKKKVKIKHVSRERRLIKWDLVQFDGTYHDRFENWETHCLLCAVDDATSETYIKFTEWESYEDVVKFREWYIKKFGKPQAIYLDRHATYKVNNPKDQRDKETETRFKRWMRQLWIEVIYARSPEWKWRVERWNQTHQDRLLKKMRLKDIKNIEEANKYVEEYLEWHNKKFSVESKQEWCSFVKASNEELDNLYRYFAKISTRVLKNDWTLQYNNKKFQFRKWLILKSNKIYVKETMNNEVRFYDWISQIIPIDTVW